MFNDYSTPKKGPNVWHKISEFQVKDPDKMARLFAENAKRLQAELGDFREHIEEQNDYFLVFEGNRDSAEFIHFVPKEAWKLFREMQINTTHEFYGTAVVLGKRNNKEVRLATYGIPVDLLRIYLNSGSSENLQE